MFPKIYGHHNLTEEDVTIMKKVFIHLINFYTFESKEKPLFKYIMSYEELMGKFNGLMDIAEQEL